MGSGGSANKHGGAAIGVSTTAGANNKVTAGVPAQQVAIASSTSDDSRSAPCRAEGNLPPGVNYDAASGMYEVHSRNAGGKFVSMGQFKTAQAAREKYLELHPAEKLLAAVGCAKQPLPDDEQEVDAGDDETVARPSEFTVSLDRDIQLPLGITAVATADRKALVVMHVRTGAISSWNKRNPERQVKIGDRIVKVGEASERAEQLMSALNQRAPFDIVVRVPEEFRVCLSKGSTGKLGIEVAKRNAILQVKKVGDDGVMKKWNDANPALAVHPYHFIIEVNGVRDDADLMVTEVEFEQTVGLLLR